LHRCVGIKKKEKVADWLTKAKAVEDGEKDYLGNRALRDKDQEAQTGFEATRSIQQKEREPEGSRSGIRS